MHIARLPPFLGLILLGACATQPTAGLTATPARLGILSTSLPPGQDRISGPATTAMQPPRPTASYGTLAPPAGQPATASPQTNGDISFDFADTDIRAVAAQILGGILHVNYTIDPSVSGTVTLRTTTPLTRDAVLPTLQTLLAQNNAMLVQTGGLYRVTTTDQAAASPGLAASAALGGSVVLKLHYASASQLASILQPYVSKGGAITADPSSNALVIQGDPATRDALTGLVQAFDVDALAGQSYELFPVTSGNTKDFADAFTAALAKHSGGDSKGPDSVTVVPLERISAVLVIARAPSYLTDATQIYGVLNQGQQAMLRSWHVFYLRNSRANDAAYLLQQAFTPDSVTAQPTQAATQSNTSLGASGSSGSSTGSSTSSSSGSGGVGGLLGSSVTSGGSTDQSGDTGSSSTAQTSTSGASALLGPLSSTSSSNTATGIRVIPDIQNNSLLIYATVQEDSEIEGMLSKIDIMPLEVRIDATIAEVDLTGKLQYGTQYYFKSGDINAVLSTATTAALDTSFPGFVLSGAGSDAAPLAISALQAVTKVRVLSSPELMVMDGQAASLQVGDLVPYLSSTSQSTTSNSAVIDSIDYRETGVILRVTPHVGSGGMVTMDVGQEVSGVSPTVTTTGLNSPTFTERAVTSRVAIQDGQTIGLAGLISDNDSHENQGIPFLKNIPLLGGVFGSQTNSRTREELLVLITPHVIRSQQQALDLTEDLQQQLPNAAQVRGALQSTPIGGSADPDAAVNPRLGQ
ncbi:MAG: type II secretion system secretin GspD [Acidocella sp.]|nr:type II secretion system secretin GspD [Acidocella sp.]